MFFDESYMTLDMARTHGYGPIGEEVHDHVPKSPKRGASVMACLGAGGIVAPDIEYGSVNTDRFRDYLLYLTQNGHARDGMVFVLDNAKFHHAKVALDVLANVGVRVIFLPPYSPDYNPIEHAWSKIKKILRDLRPRSHAELVAALKIAFAKITKSDAAAWSENAGYA